MNLQEYTMKSTNRTPYVDIAKGIAILSVVLLHVDFVYPKLSFINISGMLGWYWHVPVFFLIGGFFLKKEKLLHPVSFIKGKFKSLYLLALIIYLSATLLHNVLFKLGWYSPDWCMEEKSLANRILKNMQLASSRLCCVQGTNPSWERCGLSMHCCLLYAV